MNRDEPSTPIPQGSSTAEAAHPTPRPRRFDSLTDFLKFLGATRTVSKILVANNGLAAVKGITSIRNWCNQHLDMNVAKHCIEFEAMPTPEDLNVDAEFCHLAEHYVETPGGKNVNNYANVDLIVQIALQQRCDAVYPGWGHASENPALPRELLNKTGGRVQFLGPGETAMFSLGDKIASTIIAQSFGVPCAGWSGSHVRIPPGSPPGVVPPALHHQSYVHTLEECVDVCEKVGYPVMLKASEGGGGKGIRRVLCKADVAGCYSAVKDEVVGCHIFVMKMLSNVRHLEVQLLADSYGECIAVRTRDCSVQRRHQKIIEEGPVVAVADETILEMEQSAVRMAKAVGYVGLGTVEFMYDRDSGKFFFLELNPRVQVEHPVSELISGVNLPAALMLVCMGVPLHRIPEVRKYYGAPGGKYGVTKIDFENVRPLPPRGHAIAVRITAEDAEEGFRPTTGSIEEISFKDSEDCWGYFSVGHGRGGIHQFADSQFGHIFAISPTREEARRSMILALRTLVVRGEIRYSTPFVIGLLEREEFVESKVHTAWLDGILAGSMVRPSERQIFQALAAGAVHRLCRQNKSNSEDYLQSLAAGHTPSSHLLDAHRSDTFIVESKKYTVHSSMMAPSIVALVLNGTVLQVHFRELQSSGGMHLQLGSRNVVAHVEEEAIGCRVSMSNSTLVLTADADPTKLRASVSGKLVRYLVQNGDHVSSGSPYCEIEVMKMIYPLVCNVTGTVQLRAAPGATLQAGKLLAEITPDDPSAVARAESDLTSGWPESLMIAASRHIRSPSSIADAAAAASNSSSSPEAPRAASTVVTSSSSSSSSVNAGDDLAARADSNSRARHAVQMLWMMLQGYHPSGEAAAKAVPLTARIDSCLDELSSLGIYSVTLRSLALPFLSFPDSSSSSSSSGAATPEASSSFVSTTNIGDSTSPIVKLHYVLQVLLTNFLEIEQVYNRHSRASAIEALTKVHGPDNLKRVYEIDFIHHKKHRIEVAKRLLQLLGQDRVLLCKSIDLLQKITNLASGENGSLVLSARFLLRNAQGPTFEEQKAAFRDKLEQGLAPVVRTTSVSTELACAVLFDAANPNTVPAVLEFILRRTYYGEANVVNYDVFRASNDWRFSFRVDPSDFRNDVLSKVPGEYNSVSPMHKVRLADAGFGLVVMEDRNLEASLKRFGESVSSTLPQHLPLPRDKTVYGLVFARCRSDCDIQELSEEYRQAINSVEAFHRLTSEVYVFYITIVAYGAPNGPYFFTFCKPPTATDEEIAAGGGAATTNVAAGTPINERGGGTSGATTATSSSTSMTGGSGGGGGAGSPSTEEGGTPSTNAGGTAAAAAVNYTTEFQEDKMLRNVFAPTAGRLETRRLEKHYNVNIIPQFGNRKIHLYVGTPKQSIKGASARPADMRRLFVRCFFSPADLMMQPWDPLTVVEAGQVMSSVVSAVELAFADSNFVLTKMNHLFVNLVEISMDIAHMPSLIGALSASFGDRLKRLRFHEVEVSFRVPIFQGNDKSTVLGTIPVRIFANNTTGYATSVSMFAEVLRADGHTELHCIETPSDVEKFITKNTTTSAADNKNTGNEQTGDAAVRHFDAFDPEGMAMSPVAGSPLRSSSYVSVSPKEACTAGWGGAVDVRMPSVGSLQSLEELHHDIVAGGAAGTTSSANNTPTGPPAAADGYSVRRALSLRRLSRTLPGSSVFNSSDHHGGDAGSADDVPLMANEAYPPLTRTQLKRLQAHSTGTTYVHDWLVLIEVAAKRSWKQFRKVRGCTSAADSKPGVPAVPRQAVTACQLVLVPSAAESNSESPTPTKSSSSPNKNNNNSKNNNNNNNSTVSEAPITTKQSCGMIAWKCDILLPSRYDEKTGTTANTTIVVVANDITWESGAFSIVEDRVFAAVSVYAREHNYPFLYLSANSGARIGLATDVQNRFHAALKHSVGGDATLDYIYLTKSDLDALAALEVGVVTEPLQVAGSDETRYKIIDVIGNSKKDPIGVENLQGSALLAGQMSLNYATIPTLSVVSGRSVGIGAYLNRLGRRVVQVQGAPIILTGFQAINRLLGKEVYSSQDQLGGNDIMQPNGVSHWGAHDDLDAVVCALRWLSVVGPAFQQKQMTTMITSSSSSSSFFSAPHVAQHIPDPIDRDVTFAPKVATPYDPRLLIDAASDKSTLGIFDLGSFHESLSRWASSVVVGRATLGGIPVGVISVETRTTTKLDPADPADLDSRASNIKQAGQVWFPDSSRKTADALEDFRNEGLPCFVIANWRGFSGGMRDMFNEVLKFGASIVDNLRVYDQPVIIYIPPFGELRGGSWVVLDPVINHNGCVEMYCDPLARGGILEPAGIVNVKFKDSDVRNLWRRSREAQVREEAMMLEKNSKTGSDAASAASASPMTTEQIEEKIRKAEEQEHALFTDIAVTFADLHDTPGRMLAVKCINDIVPLKEARRYFYWKLRRQMVETAIAKVMMTMQQRSNNNATADKKDSITLSVALDNVRKLVAETSTTSTQPPSPTTSIESGGAAAAAANSNNNMFAETLKRERSTVEFLESEVCFKEVQSRCKNSQVNALLATLQQLKANVSGDDDASNISQIEALIAKTFSK